MALTTEQAETLKTLIRRTMEADRMFLAATPGTVTARSREKAAIKAQAKLDAYIEKLQ